MCGPQCPVCRTVIENPKEFVEPAPFVLQKIISELDFQCPTCIQTIKLHQLPQHQEGGISYHNQPLAATTAAAAAAPAQPLAATAAAPAQPLAATAAAAAAPAQPLAATAAAPAQPLAATETAPAQPLAATAATLAHLPAPGPATTYGGQLTIQQLLHSPKESYSSIKYKGGSWAVYYSPIPYTVAGWDNNPPQNRRPGKYFFHS